MWRAALAFSMLSGIRWVLALSDFASLDEAVGSGELAEARGVWERLQLEQDVGNVPITPAFLQAKYFCSIRTTEAETGLAHGDGERRAALWHHLSGMEDLNAACRMRSCGGESPGPDAMAGDFVVEAKRWIAAGEQ